VRSQGSRHPLAVPPCAPMVGKENAPVPRIVPPFTLRDPTRGRFRVTKGGRLFGPMNTAHTL
jgi:hypothetical protein